MRLLLLTSAFPHRDEFLDREIVHLADHFERITVLPSRPTGIPIVELPDNVEVDYSFAESLAPRWKVAGTHSRRVVAMKNAVSSVRLPLTASPQGATWGNRAFLRKLFQVRADAWALNKWASRSEQPDIVYQFWLGPSSAVLKEHWPEVPIVSRAHGSDLYAAANGFELYPYQHMALDSLDLVATVSDQGRGYLENLYPQHRPKIVTRRLGISDIGGLTLSPSQMPVRVLSVSNIKPVKRVPLIAEVLMTFASSGTPVHWTHLGDGEEYERVKEIVSNAPDNFTADLPGRVPLSTVYEEVLEGGYHAFVNLSLSEGAPVSIMEAQCVGLPVLATQVGGTEEVAPHHLNRLVAVSTPVKEIVEALRELVAMDEALAQGRRNFWQANYDEHVNYSTWAKELRHVANQAKAP